MNSQPSPDNSQPDVPAFFGSWRNVYVAVLVELAALIFLFHLFEKLYQ